MLFSVYIPNYVVILIFFTELSNGFYRIVSEFFLDGIPCHKILDPQLCV